VSEEAHASISDWENPPLFVLFEGVESAFYLYENGKAILLKGANHPDWLTAAEHACDLVRVEETHLYLDLHRHGLGGESCGPTTPERYQLKPQPMTFGVILRPIGPSDSPMALSRGLRARGARDSTRQRDGLPGGATPGLG